MKSAGSQFRTDISMLGAAIACSQIVLTSPSATAQPCQLISMPLTLQSLNG
jgi:hypothetical protein